MQAIRDRYINQTVFTGNWNSWFGTGCGKGRQATALATAKYNADYFLGHIIGFKLS
jgi:hypothetical protein